MSDEATARMMRVSARKADQDKNLFGRMLAAATASRGQAQRLLSGSSDLTITEWRILWDLDIAGPLSVQDMASIQRTDHSLISRALPAMREKGYVTTARSDNDKRQSLVDMRDAGKRAFATAEPVMKRRRAALEAAFPDAELEVFLAMLTRFEAFLEQPIDLEHPLENAG
ncbi:MAG: MarR family transcriptional regulator [Pseudomonadota bacterium]